MAGEAGVGILGLLFYWLADTTILHVRDRRLRVMLDHVPIMAPASQTAQGPADGSVILAHRQAPGLELDTGHAFNAALSAWPTILHVVASIMWVDYWAVTVAPWYVVLIGVAACLHALVVDVARCLVVVWSLETHYLEQALRTRVFAATDIEFGSITCSDAAIGWGPLTSPNRHFRWRVYSLGRAGPIDSSLVEA